MSTPTSPRAALAAAIRACNVAYAKLPADRRGRVHLTTDEDLEAALLDGDPERARAAIADWERRQLEAIRAVAETGAA